VETVLERDQYAESQRRENLVEHCLIAELLQDAWLRRGQSLDILRSEVDAAGYDLVLSCNKVTRHVQVKSSKSDARAGFQPINGRLADVPSGCVVWVRMKEDHERNRVELAYWFYGNAPGEPLILAQFRKAKHTRANATGEKALRENTFRVNRGLFQRLVGVEELSDRLFGAPAVAVER
jgi:hypothetical protein